MKFTRIVTALLAALIVVLLGILIKDIYDEKRADEIRDNIRRISRTAGQTQENGYTSPINFPELKEINSDIYAWIEIPGTNVDLPVVQKKDDNTFYMSRDITGRRAPGGSLYTENCNSLTFGDKVTVIYGHNMKSGAMFGEMKNYSSEEYFEKNNQMNIYLPDCTRRYKLVAAIPFDNRHIMHSYDFSSAAGFRTFAYDVFNIRNVNSRYAADGRIDRDDKLVILSTCYFNRRDMRYLIVWKEIDKK